MRTSKKLLAVLDDGLFLLNAPTNLAASAGTPISIDLTWDDNSTNETGFEIERSLDDVDYTLIHTTGADETSYTDVGLSPNTLYYYRVRAVNAITQSSYSTADSETTPTSLPGTPTDLVATTISASEIDLTWTDNATGENGYSIERSIDDVDYAEIADISPNSESYSDTGLTADTLYYYRVRIYNNPGPIYGDYSNVDSATTEAA